MDAGQEQGGALTSAASNTGSAVPRQGQHARWAWLIMVLIVAAAILQLRFQGRRWWCACGQPFLWSGNVWSAHNSQHLGDPYSFTHVLHGMLFYGALAWILPRVDWRWRFVGALTIEALWEVIENTQMVIDRYRETTISVGYTGDSVFNSLGDILSFAFGHALARRLGFWPSVAIFLVTESLLIFWIRDSLLLNVLMLLYPIEAVRVWQAG
jgi:uncharacterized protein DUF2585